MKKTLLLSVLSLSLAACAPAVQLAQPNERATLTQDGQSLLLTNPGPDALVGDPGRPGDGPVLAVDGAGLALDVVATRWCTVNTARTRADCTLPDVPAGQRLRVTFTAGQIHDAAVLAYRPGLGSRPVAVWLK